VLKVVKNKSVNGKKKKHVVKRNARSVSKNKSVKKKTPESVMRKEES
jgi:hypothetical protein